MPLTGLDAAGVSRALAQLMEEDGDLADAFFERAEEIELDLADRAPRLRARLEEGFAVRLVRGRRCWLAARDRLDAAAWADAVRQVARAAPLGVGQQPRFDLPPHRFAGGAPELAAFPALVERRLRERHVGLPVRFCVRRHRRWIQVVGPRLVPDAEREGFYSCSAEIAWGRLGVLLAALDEDGAERVAAGLVARFRAREAEPPGEGSTTVVLAPAAAAVFLHEAVAHALEADTLALTGRPEAAIGVAMGSGGLDVLDDPAAAPEGVRRATDDEGVTVVRRWLLRSGVVHQPLADVRAARESPRLLPGAGRRSGRQVPPAPRCFHLEVLPGDSAPADLLAGVHDGLLVPEASEGTLDRFSGEFRLAFPYARRIRQGEAGELVACGALRGRVAAILGAVTATGRDVEAAGAGWCAKGGHRLPVWATAPALRLEGVWVGP